MKFDIIIIGGGAAGFFTAIQCAENNPDLKIVILEKTQKLLSKVKISGGGRCNVTHGCFDPRDLTTFYPRGEKELLGPFHKFMCGDMMAWLEDHGVVLKIEDDGRAFPVSDDSQTIIDCFLSEINKYKITISKGINVDDIVKSEDQWHVMTRQGEFVAPKVVFATGSNKGAWGLLGEKGHTIVSPVPSLFTFKIKDPLIADLMGVSIPLGTVTVVGSKLEETGPVLITHWGLSGPAILKLSSRGARMLNERGYHFHIHANWTSESYNSVEASLLKIKKDNPKRQIINRPLFNIPNRLWQRHIKLCQLEHKNWGDLSKMDWQQLAQNLTSYELKVTAKATNKDEFVTAGGVDLNEINFKNMQSKILPNIYFAGEVLNIDALTGGFNFQSAWTTSFLIGQDQYT